ncbi:MAG: arylsulfatase [Halioglobus sp.]|nr:arylsulfatase [Halioglobus sp.]
MNRFFKGLVLALMATAAAPVCIAQAAPQKPNIVLIVADDVALMDFGVYGGEARTPTIDALAEEGVMFGNHHATPMCAPSRAMLLTGMDNHLTGMATIPEVLPPEHRGQPGYSMHLEEGVRTIADYLRPLGYRTLMTGKWHLGHGPGQLPDNHGFDRSFVLDASGADNWEQRPYIPYYAEAPWFEDGEPATLPDDFYSSAFLVDRMIEYIDSDSGSGRDKGDRTPFFAYLSFQAVHIPVQAPREFSDNYRGVYDAGWEQMRLARWERAKDIGLIPADAPLADMHPLLAEWSSLGEERALYSRRMEVNAGMLEAMDYHIGRFIDHLRQTGRFENTLFIVTSDNGPEGARPTDSAPMRAWLKLVGYDLHTLETLGEKGSYSFIGPAWASAAASPSDLFKFYSAQGGLRVPLIMHGPGVPRGEMRTGFSVLSDIAPTILEMVGGEIDGAITGRSLLPVIRGDRARVYPKDAAVGIETAGNAALFRGDYKLVRNLPPFGDGQWKLYDWVRDPGETRDLAQQQPELFAAMRAEYDSYAQHHGVLEMPEDFEVLEQVMANSLPVVARNYWWVLVLAGTALLLIVAVLVRLLFRFRGRSGPDADKTRA